MRSKEAKTPVKAFVSYSHLDQDGLTEIFEQLKLLKAPHPKVRIH